jgi:hypothetical protein
MGKRKGEGPYSSSNMGKDKLVPVKEETGSHEIPMTWIEKNSDFSAPITRPNKK